MSEEFPYKLGLIKDHKPPRVPDLAVFATTPEPTPPASVEGPQGVIYPMADNDTIGDCTIAGATHVNQAGAAIVSEPWSYQGDAATSQEYFSLTGGQDTGLELPQVLEPWHTVGLWNQGKNGGYWVVQPKNTTAVKRTIWIAGSAYIAVNLPEPAQGQFNPNGTGVWQLTGTSADYNIVGGHCVVPVGYSADGVITVTWGSTVLITWQWWATYVDQVYGVIAPGFVEKGGDGRGYDLAAIDAFLPAAA
jgi:hypothetical protein